MPKQNGSKSRVKAGQAGATLRANEFRALVESLPDLVFRYRFSPPAFEYVSPASVQLLGYAPAEFYADSALWTKIVHPDDRSAFQAWLENPARLPNPPPLRWLRQDGAVVWIRQHNTLVRDKAGRIVAVLGTARDITDRRRAESQRPPANDDLERSVVERTVSLETANAQLEELAVRLEEEITERNRAEEQILWLNHDLEQRAEELANANEELEVAIEELRVANENLEKEAVERQRAEQALRESEARFRFVLAKSPVTVVNLDRQLRYIWIYNPAGGFRSEDLLGKTVGVSAQPDDQAQTFKLLEAVIANGTSAHWETANRTPGGIRCFESYAEPVRDDRGEITGVAVVSIDITARRRAEEQLRESEERFFKAFVLSPVPMTISLVNEGRWVDVNDAYTRLVEYSREELLGHTSAELNIIDPAERARLAQVALKEGSLHGAEVNLHTKSGKQILALYFIEKITLNGREHSVVTTIDVTERKRAEQQLRQSEANFSKVFHNSPAAMMITRLADGKYIELNEAYTDLVGYGRAELLGHLTTEFNIYIRPEQRQEIVDRLRANGYLHNYEATIQNRSGEIQTVLASLETIDFNNEACILSTLVNITARKQAEEALAHSNARLSKVLDSIQDDFYVLDRDWKFVFANRQFTSKVGKEPEDFIGNRIWEMFPKHVGSVLEENYRATMEKGEIRRFEVGGKYTNAWYSMTSYPSAEGITVLGSDITARKKMEEALALAHAQTELDRRRLEKILETTPAGVVLVESPTGKLSYMNRRAAEIFGAQYQGFDLETRLARVKALKPDGTPYRLEEMPLSHALQGEQVDDAEMTIQHGDGIRVPVVVSAAPLRDAVGNVTTAIVVLDDITERKQAEAEREGLLQRERVARAEAEAAVRLRDQFITLASHELKTPLTAMQGYAELLVQRATGLNEQDARMVRTIHQQTLRLEKMIYRLLDIGRIERGQLGVEREPVELGELLTRIVQDIQPTLRRHTLEFIPSTTSVIVEGDETRLEQVLQNLVQNAVKYSPLGGEVSIRLTRTEGMARVAVHDSGIGIPAADLPQLFTRFYRARNAEAYHISGLGVGLFVAREIVLRHGGEITVESEEGKGSTFTVSLPLAAA